MLDLFNKISYKGHIIKYENEGIVKGILTGNISKSCTQKLLFLRSC
jgi:hypothetical protein